jgi:hypothetical protein
MTFPNLKLDLIQGGLGLALTSQTVGSLLRTPGFQSQPEKWIRQRHNLINCQIYYLIIKFVLSFKLAKL